MCRYLCSVVTSTIWCALVQESIVMQRERLQVRMLLASLVGEGVSHTLWCGVWQEAKQALREAEDRLENRKKGHTMNAKAWAAAAQSSAQRRALELLNRQRVCPCCLEVSRFVVYITNSVVSLSLSCSVHCLAGGH